MSAQMVLTGLLIMADWIASNTAYFQLISVEDSGNPAVYPERADIAWETLRLPKPCWNWKEVYLMYLTRIELDVYRRSTMRALTKPNYLHGAVEAAFPNERERGRRLWRLDTLYGKQYLMLVSEQKPDLQKMQVNYGTDTPWETREYTPLLNRIQTDGVWRFCLTANPTKSCKTEQDARGKVHAHISTQYQEQWLMERAEKHGFSVQPDEFEVVSSQWYSFQKGEKRRRVSLLAVTYEGILRVTDAEAFRKTLTEGIGRGKAYGMGMLTVMRASSTR